MTYIPAVTANVSVLNSTVTSFSPENITYTGTPEDVSQYASLSVSYQVSPYTATGNIFLQFSNIANPFTPISNTVTPITSTTANGFTLDTTMTCQFFRVMYVSDSTSGSVTIQTIYHPQARIAAKTSRLAEPMTSTTDCINTRSFIWGKTNGGNVYEQIASNGTNSLLTSLSEPLSTYGDIAVSENTPVSQIDFVYGVNTTISSNVMFSNATITTANSMVFLTSNGYGDGAAYVSIYPKRFAKYRPGQGILTRFTAMFSTGVTGTIQFAGCGFLEPTSNAIVDGFGIGYDGTQLSILWYNNYTKVGSIPQASWNLDTLQGTGASGMTLVPQNLNVFQCRYQYLGGGDLSFYIMNPLTARWILFHVIQNAGTQKVPIFSNPTMRLIWYSYSGSGKTGVSVAGASGGQFVDGQRKFLGPKGALSDTNVGISTGTPQMIFAIKNATYFNGVPNRSLIHIRNISLASSQGTGGGSGPGIAELRLIRNPTFGTPGQFFPYNGTANNAVSYGSNIYSGQSTLSSNVSNTFAVTGGNVGFAQMIPFGGQASIDVSDYEIYLVPGDILCFQANVFVNSNSSLGASVFWVEDI